MIASLESSAPVAFMLEHPIERDCPITGLWLPGDVDEAAKGREMLLAACQGNKKLQEKEIERCRESILYFCNWFVWTFVIRKYGEDGRVLKRGEFSSHVPFVTWPVQDAALLELVACIEEGKDAIIDKSRDMGASWLAVVLGCWLWLFRDEAQVGLCARVEDDVDKEGNPKTLFWKIDYLLGRLPDWMLPCQKEDLIRGAKHRGALILRNPVTGAVIRGEATTDHMFRGDRLVCIIFDEMAAQDHAKAGWQSASDSTSCKIGNSTPIGPGTEYTIQRNKGVETGTPRVIELGYWNHPDKGIGRVARRDVDGEITGIAGRIYWDTPYFRAELLRRDPQDVGQNLLIDHITSGDLFFNASVVTNHLKRNGRDPKRYELTVDDTGGWGFEEDDDGRWYVWCDLTDGLPDQDQNYVAFADLSHGRGASNSVCAFMGRDSGDIVAEFVSPHISTYDFADEVCSATQNVFCGGRRQCFLGYEVNGPGEDWHRDLKRNGQTAIFIRRRLGKMVETKGVEYGWRSDRKAKRSMLKELSRALARSEIRIFSRMGLSECLEYVFYEDGSIGPGHLKDEQSGAREAHGDRVIAYGGCVFMRREVGHYYEKDIPPDPDSYDAVLNMGEYLDTG